MLVYKVLVFVTLVAPLLGASEWLKITSPNFEMYTTAGAKEGSETLEYFEQARDFFLRVRSQQVTTRLPVTIVAFKNAKEYRPYTTRETAIAYFTGDEQRDYIVMSGAGSEHYRTAVHEYIHLLIRHSGMKFPVWLNEGMAEVYSTLTTSGNKILIGAPPQGRASTLAEYKWMPLNHLLRVTQASPEFDERSRTGLFYSQSWLLTHMLMLSETYGRQFSQFTQEVSNSGSAEAALQKVYGKGLAEIEKDLQAYYKSRALRGIAYEARLQKVEPGKAQPASEFDTELTLTKLVALLPRRSEAAQRYEQLAKAYPDRWELYEAIGHLYWHAGDRVKARDNLRRAVELKSPSWKTYWDYAQLGHGETNVIDALKRALELNPDLSEARILLGLEYNNAGKYEEAYRILSAITQVPPGRAAPLFLAKAYSAAQTGRKDEARAAAAMAKQSVKTPEEISQAQQLIDFLEQPVKPAIATPPATPAAPSSEVQTIRGALQEVECLGPAARLMVTSGATRFSLLVRDKSSAQIKNLTCGLQDGAAVILRVIYKDDAAFKTTGEVVSLEFQ